MSVLVDVLAADPRVPYLVAISSSTGGPPALMELIPRLPARFPGAVLIAQHMPPKFTKTFAERLDLKSKLSVSEAMHDDRVRDGQAFVCPGSHCMEVVVRPGGDAGSAPDLRIRLCAAGAADRHVPSGNRLFRSIAEAAGPRAIGVILTGMGDDGIEGAGAILHAGGVVFGGPHAPPLSDLGTYLAGLK